MCAYANNQQSGGWVWSQGQSPPTPPPGPPVMVYQGMPNPPPMYYGQPQYVEGGRGRGRNRGASSNAGAQNLVTRVKAEIQVARPGQVLEIARFAASQLSSRSPVLYKQLLAGLLGADLQVTAGSEEKSTVSLIVADRKTKWKALCAANEYVLYWQQCQDLVKAAHGANAEVDTLIAEDDSLDIRRYLRGKKIREELLQEAGLTREGSTLVPLNVDDDVDSQAGGQPPATSSNSGAKGPKGSNPQELANFVNLLTLLVSQQVKSAGTQGTPATVDSESKAPPPPTPKGAAGGKPSGSH